jgi:geranylgeranyl diphosphate synthase type II
VNFDSRYSRYKHLVDRELDRIGRTRRAPFLDRAVRYALGGGGKRIRPVLTLAACESVGASAASALNEAVAVEILHNFTLVHDDIMDHAPMRRGRKTIHTRWDENVAILAGDQMVALAYRSILDGKGERAVDVLRIFTDAFHDVCDGQGLDEELESRQNVTIRDYMRMIDKKTGAIIAAATKLGGVVGGGSKHEINALGLYGGFLGRAFQIQDDLLDVVADPKSLGKTIGGDLKEGKKTYLLLRALEQSGGSNRAVLARAMRRRLRAGDMARIHRLFETAGIVQDARAAVRRSSEQAKNSLRRVRPGVGRDMLAWLADRLTERTF